MIRNGGAYVRHGSVSTGQTNNRSVHAQHQKKNKEHSSKTGQSFGIPVDFLEIYTACSGTLNRTVTRIESSQLMYECNTVAKA